VPHPHVFDDISIPTLAIFRCWAARIVEPCPGVRAVFDQRESVPISIGPTIWFGAQIVEVRQPLPERANVRRRSLLPGEMHVELLPDQLAPLLCRRRMCCKRERGYHGSVAPNSIRPIAATGHVAHRSRGRGAPIIAVRIAAVCARDGATPLSIGRPHHHGLVGSSLATHHYGLRRQIVGSSPRSPIK